MGKYTIRVKVELVECEEAKVRGVQKESDGHFSMTIDERDAISIDKCEKALLLTAYPSIRDAISAHLSEISKKKPRKKGRQQQ
jgi:hypothetical protein